MAWVALKMLTGDRSKFFGIVFGVMFASLLIAHQATIFVGLMGRTSSQIKDVREPDFWVMDAKVRYVDEVPSLRDTDLLRVRSVPGVAWAVPMHKSTARARLRDGNFRQVVLLGIDDDTFIGAPQEMVLGNLADLRRPDAFLIDEIGYSYLWPNEPLTLGKVLEMNDRRAVLVGVCKAGAPFVTLPIVYARYSQAIFFAPRERNMMTFVLAKAEPGQSVPELGDRIFEHTGRVALTHEQFQDRTVNYYLKYTGIPVNFGIVVVLGFVVGVAIAGQTFYLFTIENLKQFGALKAMGVGNLQLVRMILLQALVVGVLGYCLGIGLAALFFESTAEVPAMTGFKIPWGIMAGTAVAVLCIVMLASLLSIRKVLVLEPAIVFRG